MSFCDHPADTSPGMPRSTPTLEFKPNLRPCVERMRRFWSFEEPLDRVPATVRVPVESGAQARVLDGTFFGRMDAYLAHQERVFRLQAQVPDETLPVVHPQFGHALVGALLGAPLRAASETVWVEPMLDDLDQATELRLDWDNRWGRRFLEELERLREWAGGRCALANYEVEGVADTMAALRGTTRLLLDAQDRPDRVEAFAAHVTDLLIEFGRWSCRNIGVHQPLLGGETTGWRLWMPGDAMCFAEDATVMVSPEFYARHVKAHDRRLASAFAATILEVHHEGNHQLAQFGDVEGVSLLTIENWRRMSNEHRQVLQSLVGRKRLLLYVGRDEVEETLRFLGTRGVMLGLAAPDVMAAGALLAEVERATAAAGKQ